MERTINGIHHVTAICRDANLNVDFYSRILGMRFLKKTVNFDDPSAYHLYYGDGAGSPGTLTFFPYPDGAKGVVGTGQTSAVALEIPTGSMEFWEKRLGDNEIFTSTEVRFGQQVLVFHDFDGMQIELFETDKPLAPSWDHALIPAEVAIQRVGGVTLMESQLAPTESVLKEMAFERVGEDGDRIRFTSGGSWLDIIVDRSLPRGRGAIGSVHHVAWRTPNDDQQAAWLERLTHLGFHASPVMDRNYFHSIYFREPGGVLFEIATDGPGFDVDEPVETLGTELKLPAHYESIRAEIVARLPELVIPGQGK
jgi:glyoxalase family protein